MENIIIYGISGKIGSGKDYIAKNVLIPLLKNKRKILFFANNVTSPLKKKEVLFLAFADSLKIQCSLKYGSTYEKLYEKKDDITRGRLQGLSDEIKKDYGQDAYVNALRTTMLMHYKRSGINFFVITDVRFPQELKFIQDNGGTVIRIEAPGRTLKKLKDECGENYKKRANHISETALDSYKFKNIIYNDEGDDAVHQMKKIIY